jgi:hypothetical protein
LREIIYRTAHPALLPTQNGQSGVTKLAKITWVSGIFGDNQYLTDPIGRRNPWVFRGLLAFEKPDSLVASL